MDTSMTSILGVKELQAASGTSITVKDGNIIVPSSIIQVKYVRMDTRIAYTAQPSGTGTKVPDLSIGIAPKHKDSIIFLSWMLNIEANENVNWTIHEGDNVVHGENDRWHGITTTNYDADPASTPSNVKMIFWVPAINTEYRRYTPVHKSSNANAYTVTMNRTLNSTGQDSYETMISTGVAMELTP